MGGLGLCEVVDNFLIRIGLLDVYIVEVYNGVSIREGLAPHAIAKDDLLLSVEVSSLHLAVITYDLLQYICVSLILAMVLIRHLHLKVFFLVIFDILVLLNFDPNVLLRVFLVINTRKILLKFVVLVMPLILIRHHLLDLVLVVFKVFKSGGSLWSKLSPWLDLCLLHLGYVILP